MTANSLNNTTYNAVAANTVNNAVIDAAAILAWRQNLKSVVDQHASEINSHLAATNGWRIYNTLGELGITEGSETIEQICEAMPNLSQLIYMKTTSNTSNVYPATAGILTIVRRQSFRIELRFFNGSSGGQANEWIGYYDINITPTFTGWFELAKSSDVTAYETGTWTPALQFGGSSSGIAYADRFGRYTRIGNVLHWECDFILTNKGSATGDASIAGLPFASNSARPYANIIGGFSRITLPANVTGIAFYTPNNSPNLFLRQVGNGLGLTSTFTDAQFANDSAIRASGKYTI